MGKNKIKKDSRIVRIEEQAKRTRLLELLAASSHTSEFLVPFSSIGEKRAPSSKQPYLTHSEDIPGMESEYDSQESSSSSNTSDKENSNEEQEAVYAPPAEASMEIRATESGSEVQQQDVVDDIVNVERGRRACVISLDRNPCVQREREKLPIFFQETEIMDSINNGLVTIVSGETGCGKTTQIPQFLYEAGYGSPECRHRSGRIAVTQPRRIAAINMCKRVEDEMNLDGGLVAYHVRHNSNVSQNARIVFMTDGILLREVASDFLLGAYSVIIVDEVHERSLSTDILIGMLGRIVAYRERKCIEYYANLPRPWTSEHEANAPRLLRLVVMSATLDITSFGGNVFLPSRLFPSEHPPVHRIDTRQHVVNIHFSKHTDQDYADCARKKVQEIHSRMPRGNILVFVTGKDEIHQLCRLLQHESKLVVCPLYSSMPISSQMAVFREAEACSASTADTRACIISTNVAESSVTIPGVSYVVDTGKVKERTLALGDYGGGCGAETYQIGWISKASADQRAGRAGRHGPGHCYRLYSSSTFSDVFPDFPIPEILRSPIISIILQLKAIDIDDVQNFPFITRPSQAAIGGAEMVLQMLGAVEPKTVRGARNVMVTTITDLGRQMALFPIHPRHAKLILSVEEDCLPYAIILASMLSVEDPFCHLEPAHKDTQPSSTVRAIQSRRHFSHKTIQSDTIRLFNVGFEYMQNGAENRKLLCERYGLGGKQMDEMCRICLQLRQIVGSNFGFCKPLDLDTPPTDGQLHSLLSAFLGAYQDKILYKCPEQRVKGNRIGYLALGMKEYAPGTEPCTWFEVLKGEMCYVDGLSCLFSEKQKVGSMPPWIVCEQLKLVQVDENRKILVAKGCSEVSEHWIANYCRCVCRFEYPKGIPSFRYDMVKDEITVSSTPKVAESIALSPMNVSLEMFSKVPERSKVVAALLLDGTLFKDLQQFNPPATSPSIIFRRNIPVKYSGIWETLARTNIDTRQKLVEYWREDQKFLLNEYLNWYDASKHSDILQAWPPGDKKERKFF